MSDPAPAKKINRLLVFIIPVIIFFVFLILPVIFSKYVQQTLNAQVKAKFEKDSTVLQNAITNRLSIYETALLGVKGLFAASKSVERNEFIDYLNTTNIQERFPGISGTSFTQHVLAKDKQAFIDSVRKDTSATASGYPDFIINPPGDRAEYYVVTYTNNPNVVVSVSSTFGRDFLVDPGRSPAIKEAVESGNLTITSIITLFGNPPRKGFIVFVPVYKNGMPIKTVEERKEASWGVLNGVFSTDILFSTILSEKKIPKIDFEVYDTPNAEALSAENLLYDSNTHDQVTSFSQTRQIKLGGRIWTVRLSALPGYGIESTEAYLSPGILVGGVLFSFLLSIALYLLLNARVRAVSLAEKMTKELKQKEEQYRTIFETLQDVYYRTDIQGEIIAVSPSIEQYIGIPAKDIIGRNANDFYYDARERDLMLQKLQEKGKVTDYSLTLKGRNQQPIYVSLTGHLLFDEKKNPIGLEGILRDVTERKKFEEQLQTRTQELERMNKLMTGRELAMIEIKKELERLKQEKSQS